ncbi:DMT family transporter [Streptomyces platensis]|uniref:DMT family transporter n=1 Tax=Streptomyces platensis TaxID=58346 RepID=UPI0039B729C5
MRSESPSPIRRSNSSTAARVVVGVDSAIADPPVRNPRPATRRSPFLPAPTAHGDYLPGKRQLHQDPLSRQALGGVRWVVFVFVFVFVVAAVGVVVGVVAAVTGQVVGACWAEHGRSGGGRARWVGVDRDATGPGRALVT